MQDMHMRMNPWLQLPPENCNVLATYQILCGKTVSPHLEAFQAKPCIYLWSGIKYHTESFGLELDTLNTAWRYQVHVQVRQRSGIPLQYVGLNEAVAESDTAVSSTRQDFN